MFGGSGFYEFLDDCTEIEIDHALRATRVTDQRRHGGRSARRLHRPPRPPPRVRRPPGAVPRQRVGDGVGRRPLRHRTLLGRIAAARPPPRRLRGRRSDRRPDDGPRRHVPRRRIRRRPARVGPARCTTRPSPSRTPPTLRSILLDAARSLDGVHGARRRHDGGDQRPTVLHPRRERVVPPDGLARREHDGLSRSGARRRGEHPVRRGRARSPTTTPASTVTNRSRWTRCSRRCGSNVANVRELITTALPALP